MLTNIGEYIVGAYLKVKLECDFVDYNVRPPGGGLTGLEELDVIGINFGSDTVYLCEVTTHIRGVLYKNTQETISRIQKKFERQKRYAEEYLSNFSRRQFMFWSPVVPKGKITRGLAEIEGLELYINERYKECIEELREFARSTTHDVQNPVVRLLQILEHLRG